MCTVATIGAFLAGASIGCAIAIRMWRREVDELFNRLEDVVDHLKRHGDLLEKRPEKGVTHDQRNQKY